MTNDNEDKWIKDVMNEVEWPEVPADLHARTMSYVEQSDTKLIFFFPVRKVATWAIFAFLFSFSLGMLQDKQVAYESDIIDEAPYYGISSVYIMETWGTIS